MLMVDTEGGRGVSEGGERGGSEGHNWGSKDWAKGELENVCERVHQQLILILSVRNACIRKECITRGMCMGCGGGN